MEQKLINLSVSSPSQYGLEDLTSNPKLQELLSEGWIIEQFTAMPHYISNHHSNQANRTQMALLTILLKR